MNVPNTRAGGLGLAGGAAAISGVAVFLNATAVKAYGNATAFTTMKNLMAAVCLAVALGALTRRRSPAGWTRPTTRLEWFGLGMVGVLGGAVAFVLFFEGLATATATDAAFLQKTLVVWVALGAILFKRERLRPAHVVAIAVLILGQAMLGVKISTLRLESAEIMIMAATLLWAIEALVAKRLLETLSPMTLGAARMGLGALCLVGWMVITGRAAVLLPRDATGWQWVVVTGVILAAYVICWFAALARTGVIDVTAILVAGAVLTAALDATFRDKAIQPQVAGLCLIMAGVALVALDQPRRAEREHRPPGETAMAALGTAEDEGAPR